MPHLTPQLAALDVAIPNGTGRSLPGQLEIPPRALGLVLFAHGSGSGRYSPRNQFVAERLHDAGLATLLLDLLHEDEAEDRENVFDIELLAGRLLAAARWCRDEPLTRSLPLGLFGASTGAAAALVAAAREPQLFRAIVSRGGRPDLAAGDLHRVATPTLLLVGGEDGIVVALNHKAHDLLAGVREIVVIPGATHLFPEPGALEKVAQHAADWFRRHLDRSAPAE